MQFILNVKVETTITTSLVDNVNVMYGFAATSIVLCYADGALSDVQWYCPQGTSVVPTLQMFEAVKEFAKSLVPPVNGSLTLYM
jgi:hypothetical protein